MAVSEVSGKHDNMTKMDDGDTPVLIIGGVPQGSALHVIFSRTIFLSG